MIGSLEEVNQLLEKIRSGRAGRDEVIISLYNDRKLRNSFKKMISNQGWPRGIFDTIFTDAIIAFASSVIRRKDFKLNSDIHNYILVIGRRAYVRKITQEMKIQSLEDVEQTLITDDYPMDLLINVEQEKMVQKVLGRLGRNCREVLTYWASGYSMKEIASKMNYKSDMMARKKKCKCFKELTELVKDNPKLENLLKWND